MSLNVPAMEAHAPWDPDEIYIKGDYAVLGDQIYLATEESRGDQPGACRDGEPWLLLGRYGGPL